ncbi:MAG: hypothetical protein IJR08_02380 [Bacilli bacterium]|nr:hypothetical protein [Bacilli bacterium]
MDSRFDRVYLLKAKSGEIDRVKQLCEDYRINDNGIFENAADFHFAWGFGPDGLIYISPSTFAMRKPDFNSIEQLEEFLDQFNDKKATA